MYDIRTGLMADGLDCQRFVNPIKTAAHSTALVGLALDVKSSVFGLPCGHQTEIATWRD